MPPLPPNPSLENLRKQAKRLHKAAKAKDPAARAQVGPYFGDPSKISLQQAQLAIARDYGFSSWVRLKRHVDSGAGREETTEQRANRFLDLVCIHYGPDPNRGPAQFAQAASLLAAHPEIAGYNLHTAAAAGDRNAAQRILSNNPALVDEKGGPFHWTPLMYAAYARLPGVSTYPVGVALLDAGADPNEHYMWDGTYRFAVLTGVFGDGEGGIVRQPPHPDMAPFARAVLTAGANPNDSQGAYNKCFSADDTHLELMLEFGLKDSDPTDWWLTDTGKAAKDHRTMHFQFIMAMRGGLADRAELLIENGVDLNTPDSNYYPTYTVGYYPYQVALMRGLPTIAAMIKKGGGRTDPLGGAEQFQAACMTGDLELAKSLAPEHQGVKPDQDQEMLCEACANSAVDAVKTMIELGFDLNPKGKRTPLHVAAYKGHLEVIKLLIDAGANTALRDPNFNTPPFIHAMHNHHEQAVSLLLDQPMDVFAAAALDRGDQLNAALIRNPRLVNARFRSVRTGPEETNPNDWTTPLWFACMNGRADIARVLMAKGADPMIADADGKTIIEYAREAGQGEIAEMLAAT